MTDLGLSRVSLSGTVNIQSVSESFGVLKRAVDSAAAVEIDIANVTDADLTLVQLIEAARRSAVQSGKPICLSAPASGAVLEVLQRGGFLSDLDSQRTDFWLAR